MSKALTIPPAGGAKSKFGPRKVPLRVRQGAFAHDRFMDPLALQQEAALMLAPGVVLDKAVMEAAIREVVSWHKMPVDARTMEHALAAVAETYAKMMKQRELR
jgi:hypothetical protein